MVSSEMSNISEENTEEAFMITKADYLGIVVEDVEKARVFYRDKLKLKVCKEFDMPGEFVCFELDGGAMLAISKEITATGEPVQQSFEVGLEVEDVDATYQEFVASGVNVLEKPHDLFYGRTFLFRAPEGHVLRACQPHKKTA